MFFFNDFFGLNPQKDIQGQKKTEVRYLDPHLVGKVDGKSLGVKVFMSPQAIFASHLDAAIKARVSMSDLGRTRGVLTGGWFLCLVVVVGWLLGRWVGLSGYQ